MIIKIMFPYVIEKGNNEFKLKFADKKLAKYKNPYEIKIFKITTNKTFLIVSKEKIDKKSCFNEKIQSLSLNKIYAIITKYIYLKSM